MYSFKEKIGFDNKNPITSAMHSPIFPKENEPITFTLKLSDGEIDIVNFYHKTDNNEEVKEPLKKWNWVSDSKDNQVEFTLNEGYKSCVNITYRFEVIRNGCNPYSHIITFFINSVQNLEITLNPEDELPIPIYETQKSTKAINIVFIPDEDLSDKLDDFNKSVEKHVNNFFYNEQTLRRFRSAYNFYINRQRAISGSANNQLSRKLPTNNKVLIEKMSARIILHKHYKNDVRDFSDGAYSSSEHDNCGTVIHEIGHSAFSLGDEYPDGYAKLGDKENTWNSLSIAKDQAKNYKNREAKQIGTSKYYKICINECAMNNAGKFNEIYHYDLPCTHSIIKKIKEKFDIDPELYLNENIFFTFPLFKSFFNYEQILLKNEVEQINAFTDNIRDKIDNIDHIINEIFCVTVHLQNNEYTINIESLRKIKRELPYNYIQGNNDDFYVVYKDKDGNVLYNYIIPNPRIIRVITPRCIAANRDDFDFDLFIPNDNKIAFVEFFKNGTIECKTYSLDTSKINFA